jgi:DNA-binding NarL/FixJ family response regulator
MDISKLFWDSSINDICSGYIYDKTSEKYICLICGERFRKGIIYKEDEVFMEAEMAVKGHISKVHGSVFDYLLTLDKKYTGLSDVQSKILEYFYEGYSDKDIVKMEGQGSESTIRNHRFKLKKKSKQKHFWL